MQHMSSEEYRKFQKLIHDRYGIYMASHKKEMVQGRLRKVMQHLGMTSFQDLYNSLLSNDRRSSIYFEHEVTTHKTDFFREINHFRYLAENIELIMTKNKRIERKKEIRVWSAACSTGEEAYTIAMVLKEYLPADIDVKILATDISSQVLAEAQTGIYKENDEQLSSYFINKYFKRKKNFIEVKEQLKDLVTFRSFNLMKPFSFQNYFDIIFCRNVMIYFDNKVQGELVKKFYDVLIEGGLFFIGHSESLSQKKHDFKYLQATIYEK
ncbi:CheR family methyltransferase [Natronospora cellulosivora (SeqCode)]